MTLRMAVKRVRRPQERVGSSLEELLALQLRSCHLPTPTREFQFAKAQGRRWRFDFCWPDRLIAVEVQGGTWVRGGHSRGAGQTRDCQKTNAATLLGWSVFSFTGDMVKSGEALTTVQEALR